MANNDELIYKGKALKDLRGIQDVLMSQGDPFLANIMNRAIECIENQPAVKETPQKAKRATHKYTIDYGMGRAVLYTPYDPVKRFYTLANTCFGIRKSILCCEILRKEEKDSPPYNERLEFSGDVYVWDHKGARKMLAPYPDEEWDLDYIEECAPPK